MLLSVSSVAGIVIDVAIVALIAIFAIIGLRKGFFKSVLSLFSTVVVLLISIFGAGLLAKLINKIYDFTGLIAGKLCKSIAGMNPSFYGEAIPNGVSGADIVNNIPANTNGFLKKLMSYVLKPLSASDIEGATVAEIVSGSFASVIMLIISAIILFILIKIVLALVSKFFDNITRNRVFGATNKLLGAGFGAVKGFIVVIVFTTVLTFMTVVPFINTKLTPIIQDNTRIARPIYNYTDEMVEKYIIDGKVVQKWIDGLWENKYKSSGNNNSTPETPGEPETPPETPQEDGTQDKPYTISLVKDEGTNTYNATITVDFTTNEEVYYIVDPTGAGIYCYFDLSINGNVGYAVFDAEDIQISVNDLTQLHDQRDYILKFTKAEQSNSVEVNLTLTPIK